MLILPSRNFDEVKTFIKNTFLFLNGSPDGYNLAIRCPGDVRNIVLPAVDIWGWLQCT